MGSCSTYKQYTHESPGTLVGQSIQRASRALKMWIPLDPRPKDIHRRVVFERGKPENTQMSTRKGSFKSDITQWNT